MKEERRKKREEKREGKGGIGEKSDTEQDKVLNSSYLAARLPVISMDSLSIETYCFIAMV